MSTSPALADDPDQRASEPKVDDVAPAVLVALVHWNRPEWVLAAVDSVRRSDVPVQVAVINNSAEHDALLHKALYGSATVVTPGANLGYTGGANLALTHWMASDVRFGVVASHDLTVQPTTLRLLMEALDADPALGAVGPVTVEKVGGAGSREQASPRGVRSVEWVPGLCLMFRRECINQVGGFDEVYGSYVEDVDWCHRARSAGWKVGLVAAALADGRGQGDPVAAKRQSINHVRFARLHGGARDVVQAYSRLLIQAAVQWRRSSRHGQEPEERRRQREQARTLTTSAFDLHRVVKAPVIRPFPMRDSRLQQ